jgi:hypothetical protein
MALGHVESTVSVHSKEKRHVIGQGAIWTPRGERDLQG